MEVPSLSLSLSAELQQYGVIPSSLMQMGSGCCCLAQLLPHGHTGEEGKSKSSTKDLEKALGRGEVDGGG